MSKWRYLQPLTEKTCRVIFAGNQFHASIPSVTQNLLQRRRRTNDDNDDESRDNINSLSTKIEIIQAPTQKDLIELASNAHVVVPFMEKINADFLQPDVSPNLRLVHQYGVGVEGVDIDAATNAGVVVSNIPAIQTLNAEATAEMALYLLMSLLRYSMPRGENRLDLRFQSQQLGGLPLPRTIYGKNITVVGYGAVGTVLCRYLLGMGANITVVRRQSWERKSSDFDGVDTKTTRFACAANLEEALPSTDILILACSLNSSSFHMINHESISLLCPSNIDAPLIVNVGRGPLVEYSAILEALNNGKVGGFASDVGVGHQTKPSEPWDPHDDLSNHPHVLFTPHVGGYCDYTWEAMAEIILNGIENVIDGKPPAVFINKD